jgi:hypothetical protein
MKFSKFSIKRQLTKLEGKLNFLGVDIKENNILTL